VNDTIDPFANRSIIYFSTIMNALRAITKGLMIQLILLLKERQFDDLKTSSKPVHPIPRSGYIIVENRATSQQFLPRSGYIILTKPK
jgi:hypothetical protein